jgi:hypothetical protein
VNGDKHLNASYSPSGAGNSGPRRVAPGAAQNEKCASLTTWGLGRVDVLREMSDT